jgi:hypothetical protein
MYVVVVVVVTQSTLIRRAGAKYMYCIAEILIVCT